MGGEGRERCPHCLRDFTNLRWLAAKYWSIIDYWPAGTTSTNSTSRWCVSFYIQHHKLTTISAEKLPMRRVWLHMLLEDWPWKTHNERAWQVPEPVPRLWEEVLGPEAAHPCGPRGREGALWNLLLIVVTPGGVSPLPRSLHQPVTAYQQGPLEDTECDVRPVWLCILPCIQSEET
jgi:hypothetical protein